MLLYLSSDLTQLLSTLPACLHAQQHYHLHSKVVNSTSQAEFWFNSLEAASVAETKDKVPPIAMQMPSA